jgi:hypothetical protein
MSVKHRPKLEQICLCVPPAWIQWFKRKAAADERTLSDFFRRYVRERAPDWVRLIETESD